MLASWSISTRIYAGFGVVLVLLAGLAVFTFTELRGVAGYFTEYRGTARQTIYVNDFAEDLFQARMAALKYRIDSSPDAAAEVRANIDEIVTENAKIGDYFAGDTAALSQLEGLGRETQAYRDAFDRMTALQAEREALVPGMIEEGANALENLTEIMDTAYRDGDADAAYFAGHAVRDVLTGRLYAEKFLNTNSQEDYEAATAALAQGVSELDALLPKLQSATRRALTQDAKVSIETYVAGLEKTYQAITERNAIQAETLDTLGPKMQAEYESMVETVVDRQNTLGPEASAAISTTQRMSQIVSVAAILVGLALAYFIGRWIAGAVRGMADSMSQMAEGDFEAEVTGAEHKHELGAMARALQVFADNGREKARLDAEAQKAAEAERAAAKERAAIQTDVAEVVEKAGEGDFSRRVRDGYADDTLNAFARLVNGLVENVQKGVQETVHVMGALARGDLDTKMRGEFRGAFAELQANVNGTVAKLRETVGEIMSATRDMRKSTGEISEGAADLSSRAENQAASLEEVAATMEEMSATVKKNAENAVSASSLSADARSRADKGGQIVEQAVTAMSEIEAGSGKISDIVSVIDGFAFQTNLLALNAAVEAARAGEAGKGFAVVASEVRTLAQRSAEAARDIKALIDQSSGQVKDGVRLVKETGDSLASIMDAIRQVSDTITEISEASREQSSGVDEITSALTSMDEITQQNSALAEESASAARGLGERANGLDRVVSFFRMSGGSGAAAFDADARADSAAARRDSAVA